MKTSVYTLSQRYVAYVLLVSFFLQSCGNLHFIQPSSERKEVATNIIQIDLPQNIAPEAHSNVTHSEALAMPAEEAEQPLVQGKASSQPGIEIFTHVAQPHSTSKFVEKSSTLGAISKKREMNQARSLQIARQPSISPEKQKHAHSLRLHTQEVGLATESREVMYGINNPSKPNSRELRHPISSQTFQAKGGHKVRFEQITLGKVVAKLEESFPGGMHRSALLPLYLAPDMSMATLEKYKDNVSWQKNHIHVLLNNLDKSKSGVYIGRLGLAGGMEKGSGYGNSEEEYIGSEEEGSGENEASGEMMMAEDGTTYYHKYSNDSGQGSGLGSEDEQAQWSQGENEIDEQEKLVELLQSAIKDSNLEDIKQHLKDIDTDHLLASPSLDDKNRTFFHEAAEQDGIKVFKTILEEGYRGRDINVQGEIVTKDENGETVLSIALRNGNWDLCDYLHDKSNLDQNTLEQLYKLLDSSNTNLLNLNQIVENLIDSKEGQKFLPYLLQYNYQLAENVADEDGEGKLEDRLRANLYYLLSQWEDENGGDINQVVDLGGYMEKAIRLAEDNADKKLYQAYEAALWLKLGVNEEDQEDKDFGYKYVESLADSAALIQAENAMASFLIFYVKTICALQKKENKQYIQCYDNMFNSYRQILPHEQNTVKDKLTACFGDLETQTGRNLTTQAVTEELAHTSKGTTSKLFGKHNIEKRPYRPFKKEERLPQLLKQLATQLYFSAVKQDIKLVELQLMYCEFGKKRKLFIAANKLEDATKFFNKLHTLNQKELVQLVTSLYTPTRDPEGRTRSERYSRKLSKLFNNDFNARFDTTQEQDWVLERVENVLTILQENKPQLLTLDYNKPNQKDICLSAVSQDSIKKAIESVDGNLYLVTGQCTPHPDRHAEEFLCDVFEYIKASKSSSFFACIAGKMRPCIGCSGRMKSVLGISFNPRPGKIWLHTVKNQPSDIARKSLNILFNTPNHISLTKNGLDGSGYDSGSASDLSDEENKGNDKKLSTPDTKEESGSSGGEEGDQSDIKKGKSTPKNPNDTKNPNQRPKKPTQVPRTNVELHGKSVSREYWYEDNDIREILTIEVNARFNQTIDGRSVYILGPLDNLSLYGLMNALNAHNRQRGIVLIPFNLGLSHWVGLILEYDAYGKLIQADYYDSLGGSIPGYFNKILRAHSKNRNNGSLLAFTRMQGNQLVRQGNNSDCGPCTITNLLLNAHIGYQETATISSAERRFNHLQLLETNNPSFYKPFYKRQRDNQHSFSGNPKIIDDLKKAKTDAQPSPNEYKALFDIACNLTSIPHLATQFSKITAQSSNSSNDPQEHQIKLTQLRSLLSDKQSFKKDKHNLIDEINKSIFYLDLEKSLENAPLRLAYDHLLLLGKMVSNIITTHK